MKLKLCVLTALLFSFASLEQTLAANKCPPFPRFCKRTFDCCPGWRCVGGECEIRDLPLKEER